ncbi:TolC family protein [Leptospira yasudae]|uniref:TolC family protein n=1 Tax=Leptospira yasudae TaxID=2202201 RepID=UPI001C4E796E|nr:TolC family protein [Leptospira yasudae]MBW0434936.1 TolC family protein [Leptospira yasudae]
MRSAAVFTIVFLSFAFLKNVSATEEKRIEFSEIWDQIRSQSAVLKSKTAEVRVAEIGKDRAAKHWLPKVYADVRSYRTNDPALNFLGKLGQRSANQSDFSTASVRTQPSNFLDANNQPYTVLNSDTANLFAKDTLNRPGDHAYSRGTLGVELPLFEGGGKTAAHSALEKRFSAVKSEERYIRTLEYSNAAAAFQSISLSEENLAKTESLLREIRDFLGRYRIGNRDNPVGYSGFLALRSLQNLLEVSKKEQETARRTAEETIRMMAPEISEEQLRPKRIPLLKFADQYLPLPALRESGHTPLSDAFRFHSEEAKAGIEAERARFLPKIAAYAETYAYDGSRNQANAYNAGVYLQMNLLNPSDLGALDEAKAKEEAVRKKAEEIRLKEEGNFRLLLSREKSIFENLNSIYDSVRFQEEQLKISQRLFQSGSILAPQMAESFSRMAELLRIKSATETEYLRIRGELSLYNAKGAFHENEF